MTVEIKTEMFVRLLESYGSDANIAAIARVSTSSSSKGEERDKKLISTLIKKRHTSPLEFGKMIFEVEAPMFVIPHILRHRTFNFSQKSHRYVQEKQWVFYVPPEVMGDPKSKARIQSSFERAKDDYEFLISSGADKEIARSMIPTALYSRIVFCADLHNLMNFLMLRLDMKVQPQTRKIAEEMYKLFAWKFPIVSSVFHEVITGQGYDMLPEMSEELINESKYFW